MISLDVKAWSVLLNQEHLIYQTVETPLHPKMDWLVYKILLSIKYRSSLYIQSDSIRAKVFT